MRRTTRQFCSPIVTRAWLAGALAGRSLVVSLFLVCGVLLALALCLAGVAAAKDPPTPLPVPAALGAATAMALPQYDEQGRLVRPSGFERWMFVGTSLGINYSEKPEPGPGQFHNVYVQPQAFDHYVEQGEFPEGTVFVMTNSVASKKTGNELINRHGHFAGPSQGLEVSVKDSSQFADGWAYFIFAEGPTASAAQQAFARQACYDCHAEHGEADNTFVQFYSVLTQARAARVARP